MKRILYIAFFFPPLGGAGVQRSLKFVRYLPAHGWRATVVTSKARYWMEDDSLLSELDAQTRIVRASFWGGRAARGGSTGTARSRGRLTILRSLARALMVPDAYLGWVLPASRLARRELRQFPHDAILTTSSPDSAHLLGRHLKRRTGLPWVADFRDPWTRRMAYAPPTRWHDRAHRALERSCLIEADRVIVTTEETRRDFLSLYPDIAAEKIVVIPNGYDEEDFAAAEAIIAQHNRVEAGSSLEPRDPLIAPEPEIPQAPILHAGQLNPERPIEPFLEGLRLLLKREPARAQEARTLFLGGHYDRDRQIVESFGLAEQVRFLPACSHRSSVAALLSARILLLLEQDSDRGGLLLPGKIFEYLRAGKPILALVPVGGAAARLVREFDAGWVADPARPESVAEGIAALLNRAPQAPRRISAPPPFDSVASFERRALTARLAEVLDHAVRRR